jgi:hypothetical protein
MQTPEGWIMSLPRKLAGLDAFVAGVLIGLSVITPTFAATFDVPMPPRDWLLMGSLVLLAVAVALKLMRVRSAPEMGPDPDNPDLRWWKNP